MDHFVDINHVHYSYRQTSRDPLLAVDDVTLAIETGSHVAILGRNGSGKSTLARLINALEQPTRGSIVVAGRSTSDESNIWEIRRLCGMVFQNPDNQIIGTTVEEDVAFGPENLGFPQPEIRKAVDEALRYVGLDDLSMKPPHLLSGGQKQKLAIAGIMAMRPACLILDEATSMLDPISRRDFMNLVETLVHEEKITVINITHHMEEVLLADHVYVMSEGRVVASGTPAAVFDQVDLIRQEGLDVPTHTEIAHEVASILEDQLLPMEAAGWDDARHAVLRLIDSARQRIRDGLWQPDPSRFMFPSTRPAQPQSSGLTDPSAIPDQPVSSEPSADRGKLDTRDHFTEPAPSANSVPGRSSAPLVIQVKDLSFTYSPGTAMASKALDRVSFDVYQGELLGIIGHSGSGKSTLIQHLNGLMRGQKGQVTILGMDAATNSDIRKIRQHVGLLFQYPEHQLFEETVFQDIAFGPKRMGLDMNQIERRVMRAARIVGLQQDELERSPFELSGGQKRRAAIAGILAMEPEILILDEPAAGLDPAGRDEILGYADRLRAMGVTVILVSHSMEDVARLADRVLVLRQGRVHAFGRPDQVFTEEDMLQSAGLSLPRTTAFLRACRHDLPGLDVHVYRPELAARRLVEAGLADWPDEKGRG